MGDAGRLQQILHNLIDNAIKFTHQGEVKLAASSTQLEERQVYLRVSVSDTGIGIPEDMRTKVGQVFTQLDEGDIRKYGGVGLGLALTRELIALHNGTIDVLSNPGGGTRIEFSIPYQLDVPETIAEATTADDLLLPPLTGKCILVAEDNLLNQKLAIKTLTGAGAEVDLAENGQEAVRMLMEKSYDCILMDVQMPQMDGLEATRVIRGGGSAIPIIALTAGALKGDRERCLLAGMNDYVSKPYIPKDLFQRILLVIGERFADTAPFRPERWETATVKPLLDLRPLKGIAANDQQAMLEYLQSFIDNTGVMFNHLLDAAHRNQWETVGRHAKALYASLMVLRVHPVVDMLMILMDDIRANSPADKLMGDIQVAIKLYKEALVVIEDEIRKC